MSESSTQGEYDEFADEERELSSIFEDGIESLEEEEEESEEPEHAQLFAEPAFPQVNMSLDDLLAESMGIVDEATAVAEAKRRLTKDSGQLNPREREELQQRIDTWEMVHVWRKVASVAVFHRSLCKCCEQRTENFRHYMQRCEGVKDAKLQRWYRVTEADWHLPKEVIFTESVVDVCSNCAWVEGWDLAAGEVKAHGEF